jgi:hypothetical protein
MPRLQTGLSYPGLEISWFSRTERRAREVSGVLPQGWRARAAEQAGDKETARAQYGKLPQIAAKADTARPELEAAKKYLSN